MLNNIASILGVGGGVATDYESIATASGTGSSGVITFSSIPSTYSHLQIRFIGKSSSSETQLDLTFNGSSSNYSYHNLYGNGTSAAAEGSGSMTKIPSASIAASSATSVFTAGVVDILDYSNTSKAKTVRTLAGLDTNGAGKMFLNSGGWFDTSAISSITLTCRDFNWNANSSFALYGIK